MTTSHATLSWFQTHRRVIAALCLFAFAFVFFLWLQDDPTFADPDSFYHAKMALLIRDQGIVKDFPWLQATVLAKSYTDQHLLYHIALIPFVTFFQPIVGIKIATVLLAAAVVEMVYLLLSALRVRFAVLYAFILLAIGPFIFRMSLAKAPSVSMLFLLSGILLMFKRRRWWLFILSFLYVWAYGGFTLLLVAAAIWSGIGFFEQFMQSPARIGRRPLGLMMHSFVRNEHVRTVFSVFSGIILGVVINPYFPHNLFFYWSQLVQIGIINYHSVIGVGNEWYPYPFMDLISSTIFLTVIVIIALVLFSVFLRSQRRRSWMFFIMAAFFFLLTLKSKRYVEYYVPFGMLFGATALDTSLGRIDFRHFLRDVMGWYFKHKVFAMILIVYFLVTLPAIAVRDTVSIKGDLRGGSSVTKFAAASSWLENNTPEHAVVFHSSWDEFPLLFYHNTHNYYIVGLDPTFMYTYNKDLYQKNVDITTGVGVPKIQQVLQKDFKANYVFIEKHHGGMHSLISALPDAKLVYEDSEAWIYYLPPVQNDSSS